MISIDELNKISERGYKNFSTLIIGKPYKVLAFDAYKNSTYKKRDCVRTTIEEGYLILPERFDGLAPQMKKINITDLYLIYTGRTNPGDRINIKFEELTEADIAKREENIANLAANTSNDTVNDGAAKNPSSDGVKKKAPAMEIIAEEDEEDYVTSEEEEN